ncbi:MAG: dual specificity protein phosphatase family protein [Candidatus Margulisbacteria bacterium]|nr:dual specificity protein phosphatase family protein [Candidatus Margulisiibacteriota bacterium]
MPYKHLIITLFLLLTLESLVLSQPIILADYTDASKLYISYKVESKVETFPFKLVQGNGPLPYNYRIIDKKIHTGGHPLNPKTDFKNDDEQCLAILNYLKSKGIKTIIDLENTSNIQTRYNKLLSQAGLKRIHIPMHALKVPNKYEWKVIKQAMKQAVYIHCKWGADRTGAIIGRYLVEENGYSPQEAYLAVLSGGSHAGPIGGLKTDWQYRNLKDFIGSGGGI